MKKLLTLTTLALATSASASAFRSCAEAAESGHRNIPTSSPYYIAALDRDRDGIACETTTEEEVGSSEAAYEAALRQKIAKFLTTLGNKEVPCRDGIPMTSGKIWKACFKPSKTAEELGRLLPRIKSSPVNAKGDLFTLVPWKFSKPNWGNPMWYSVFTLGDSYFIYLDYLQTNAKLPHPFLVAALVTRKDLS